MARRKGGLTIRPNGWDVGYDRWVFGQLVPAGPVAMNLVSDGLCPLGNPVATPEVLRVLPMRPPRRVA